MAGGRYSAKKMGVLLARRERLTKELASVVRAIQTLAKKEKHVRTDEKVAALAALYAAFDLYVAGCGEKYGAGRTARLRGLPPRRAYVYCRMVLDKAAAGEVAKELPRTDSGAVDGVVFLRKMGVSHTTVMRELSQAEHHVNGGWW
jgi:hypothetical protein